MKHFLFVLAALVFRFSFNASSQITGPDTVCVGHIYNFSANIPGALNYIWTVPSGWYGLTGQGTSQITVTCNVDSGQVCVSGYDSLGVLISSFCNANLLGAPGGGGPGCTLSPSGNNHVCDNTFGVTITPQMVPNGIGGGGCPDGCDNGISCNPVWGLYQGNTFIGVIGTSMNVGLGTFYAAYVDTSMGSNFPQAVQLIDGNCGGSSGGSFTITQIGLWAWINQIPNPVCVGDTVTLNGPGYTNWGDPVWGAAYGLSPITSLFDGSLLEAIVTNASAGISYAFVHNIAGGFADGKPCFGGTSISVNTTYCNVSAGFACYDTIVCENSSISFLNSTSNAITYQWSFPGGVPSTSTDTNPSNIFYGSPGTYDVMLIASNPQFADTILMPGFITVVPGPQAGFSSLDTSVCTSSCLDFTNQSSGATSYLWNFPGGIPSTSTAFEPQGICYNTSGNFDVTLISSNSDCSDTIVLQNYIQVGDMPQASMSVNSDTICSGDCADFVSTSTNAANFEWHFPGAVSDTSYLQSPSGICYTVPGSYSITLIASNAGCSDTLFVPNFITVVQSPQAGFSANPGTMCPGSCTDFINSTVSASGYLWYFPGAVPDSSTLQNPSAICYNIPGSYPVTLIAFNAECVDTLMINNYISVYQQPPFITISQIGDTLFATQGFFAYQWYHNSNIIPGATNYFHVCDSSGDYNVIATDTNACETEAAIYNVMTTLKDKNLTGLNFYLYPNPVSTQLTIFSGVQPYSEVVFQVFDLHGRELNLPYQRNSDNIVIAVSDLAPAVYIIKISIGSFSTRFKFVKE